MQSVPPTPRVCAAQSAACGCSQVWGKSLALERPFRKQKLFQGAPSEHCSWARPRVCGKAPHGGRAGGREALTSVYPYRLCRPGPARVWWRGSRCVWPRLREVSAPSETTLGRGAVVRRAGSWVWNWACSLPGVPLSSQRPRDSAGQPGAGRERCWALCGSGSPSGVQPVGSRSRTCPSASCAQHSLR